MISQADTLSLAEGKWVPIPRVSRVIPFGYEVSPEDPDLLLPITSQLEALELAKKHLKGYSYRRVAQWLSVVTGRYISHEGLKKRVEIERSRRKKAATLKEWARRIGVAQEKVRKLSEEVPGSQN